MTGSTWSRRSKAVAAHFEMEPAEFATAAALLAVMIALKSINALRYRFESDESQHLHVVWGWARGFVQYRDVCDNHMPLFHLLFAPIFSLFGDRADILYWMRFVLLPMYGLAAWCTYRIGALCFSRRVGFWAALLVGLYPGYHFCSLEFRTDNLWAPLWLCCILVLLSGPLTKRRAIGAGLLLSLCFGVSMKTILLLSSITVAAGLTFVLAKPRERTIPFVPIALFAGSAAIVPGAIMLAFARAGLWQPFHYWVFENNIVPGLTNHPAWWSYLFAVLFPVVIYGAMRLMRSAPSQVIAWRRGFLFLICGFYMPTLWSFWALVTRQDYLPFHPLAFIFYAALLIAMDKTARRSQLRSAAGTLPATVAIALIAAMLFLHPFWIDNASDEANLLRETLALTDPGDFVLDEKGETVFRQRSFGPIWEPCVMERIRRGWLVDDAAEHSVAVRACIAVLDKDISARATAFILANYLPVTNRLRVAGAWLERRGSAADDFDFDVVIPAPYEIVSETSEVAGILDGEPYQHARFLEPGHHHFTAAAPAGPLVALWAQAGDRHFTPFRAASHG